MTHSAFLVTLREHGDGAGSRFPDHPPKICHCARKRTLGGYELIGTKVALETQKKRDRFILATYRATEVIIISSIWQNQKGAGKYLEQTPLITTDVFHDRINTLIT